MDTVHTETPLTERKVLRRGLMAGIAGLSAAALMKVTGTSKVEAANGNPLLLGSSNSATAQTFLGQTASNFMVAKDSGVLISGNAIAGSNGATAAGEVGVVGQAVGSGNAGVYGKNETAGGVGVHGDSRSGNGIAIRGIAQSNGTGVAGFSNIAGDSALSGSGTGTGVYGESSSGTGISGASKTGAGVRGLSISNGIGVRGISNTGGDYNALGNGSGKGVYGLSGSGDGVHGSSTSGVGLRGTSANFVGLVGISDNNIGLYGYNATAGTPAFYAENLAVSGTRVAAWFNGDVRVMGNFVVTGNKNAAVKLPDGSEALVYCQESPEPYFEDFGRGQLVGGVARVNLEAEFASLVKRDSYMVFTTPNGECRGLSVINQDATGFTVRELQGGTSSVAFTYRVVAKRADVQGKRLERIDAKTARGVATIRALGIDGKATGAAPPTPNTAPGDPGGGRR